ncbi:MAG: hypothetical protein WDW36_009006 [Sanguina aurantia]
MGEDAPHTATLAAPGPNAGCKAPATHAAPCPLTAPADPHTWSLLERSLAKLYASETSDATVAAVLALWSAVASYLLTPPARTIPAAPGPAPHTARELGEQGASEQPGAGSAAIPRASPTPSRFLAPLPLRVAPEAQADELACSATAAGRPINSLAPDHRAAVRHMAAAAAAGQEALVSHLVGIRHVLLPFLSLLHGFAASCSINPFQGASLCSLAALRHVALLLASGHASAAAVGRQGSDRDCDSSGSSSSSSSSSGSSSGSRT